MPPKPKTKRKIAEMSTEDDSLVRRPDSVFVDRLLPVATEDDDDLTIAINLSLQAESQSQLQSELDQERWLSEYNDRVAATRDFYQKDAIALIVYLSRMQKYGDEIAKGILDNINNLSIYENSKFVSPEEYNTKYNYIVTFFHKHSSLSEHVKSTVFNHLFIYLKQQHLI